MIHHPMLLMRDPPPEIDVTRAALPKYRPFSQRYGYTDAEGKIAAKGFATLTESAAQVPEPAAPTPTESGESAQASQTDCAPSVAADQFKAGDRVMVLDCQTLQRTPHTFHAGEKILFSACPLGANPILDMYCYLRDRYLPLRPTDAELAEHWGEVLP